MKHLRLARAPQLNEQLVNILKDRILRDVYPAGSQLPSESDLSQEFNISRATVRSALNILVEKNLIIRRWGVGTFVSKFSRIANPINSAIEFHELIANAGFEPGVDIQSVTTIKADEELASGLDIEEDSRVLLVEKVFTADGCPVIYVKSYFPEHILGEYFQMALENPITTEPVFTFLENKCNQKIWNLITSIWSESAQNCPFKLDKSNSHAPVLMMEYIAYNNSESPVFQSIQAYLGDRMKFSLIRKRDTITEFPP